MLHLLIYSAIWEITIWYALENAEHVWNDWSTTQFAFIWNSSQLSIVSNMWICSSVHNIKIIHFWKFPYNIVITNKIIGMDEIIAKKLQSQMKRKKRKSDVNEISETNKNLFGINVIYEMRELVSQIINIHWMGIYILVFFASICETDRTFFISFSIFFCSIREKIKNKRKSINMEKNNFPKLTIRFCFSE